MSQWRAVAKAPALQRDERADAFARARANTKDNDEDGDTRARKELGYFAPFTWAQWSDRRYAWEYSLLDLLGPRIGRQFAADGEVLAVGAATGVGKGQKIVVEILKRK